MVSRRGGKRASGGVRERGEGEGSGGGQGGIQKPQEGPIYGEG